MTPKLGGWIHSFAVTDTQTHKGGYTIYKITSIVFPRSLPQALTCLTIWKRFHDVKRLHRELSRRHRSLKLPGQLPEPTDCSFFKRFDTDVIRRRKDYILKLLDFTAQHPALYKCHAFTQFFSEAQQTGIGGLTSGGSNNLTFTPNASPLHSLHTACIDGAIENICDNLDLHYDPYEIGIDKNLFDSEENNSGTTKDGAEIVNSINADKENDNLIVTDSSIIEDGVEEPNTHTAAQDQFDQTPCKDYTRFLTPMASIESDDSDYIYEAALEFSKAVQAEANLDYKEAYLRYKHGVELLLIGSKDDTNDERKFIAKAKISKYLARADDIFDNFVCENTSTGFNGIRKNFQLSIDVAECGRDDQFTAYLERPWNHLAKYKVLKVLGDSVMQVYCVTEPEPRTTYIMKGIEKPSSNMPTQTIFLPQHVPYMVDLLAFFQSEQKVFLLLKHAEGGRLYDYVQSYTSAKTTARASNNISSLFPDEMDIPILVVLNGSPIEIDNAVKQNEFILPQQEELENNEFSPDDETTQLTSSDSVDFTELVRSSQNLLQSVSHTLQEIKQLEEMPKPVIIAATAQPTSDPVPVLTSPLTNESVTNTFTILPEACLKQWARELAVAIHGLHVKGIILSDLHMNNLLLGAKGQLLLTYFYQNEGPSDADSYIHKAYSLTALEGHYVAPERPLTFKSDWWSYGIILYQLLLGLPFKSAHPGNIDLYGFVQYPENVEISAGARDLLEKLLQQLPEERADYEQIQAHAFFTGTDWELVRTNGVNCYTMDHSKCN
ncbi:ribosomal protein S6 kinase-like 1 [Eurosta solidaginis]|uniref:ribosomal protein S6 kinase-like 1 n=1 Tax=Eurosta solidaginis TaxID=178769 RepID=UPI0035310E47